ncbi:MAG: haloacid dehalogenase-like hydrolase [Dehalococcoidales bacterium]|nr:haloacid dehalogenase-like hydrolase [Dehalococcoidales bacterium]
MTTDKPKIAIMYDFDKTLCTKNMQEYAFLPKVGATPKDFWEDADRMAEEKKMDRVLAYMYLMLDKSRNAHKSIRRKDFVELGNDLEFYPGVEAWFDHINSVGNDLGVAVEHYIISSGLREIIEGSKIFGNFKEVFACEFLYDENDIACWPKNAVNYTTKTQFLFRINKGILDISNDDDLNRYVVEDERPVPFRNMIYIGDGLTDVPCMRLVKLNGGFSIAVYKDEVTDTAKALLNDDRVNYVTEADYNVGSELDFVVSSVISKMALADMLIRETREQKKALKD